MYLATEVMAMDWNVGKKKIRGKGKRGREGRGGKDGEGIDPK